MIKHKCVKTMSVNTDLGSLDLFERGKTYEYYGQDGQGNHIFTNARGYRQELSPGEAEKYFRGIAPDTRSRKVVLGDITIRDGLQSEEHLIPTGTKLHFLEQLILTGFTRIEVTNLGNPKRMPQFSDADELMQRLCGSKLVAGLLPDVETTAVTIRERAVARAIELKQQGYGPDRILLMVSTSEAHHKTNSGLSLKKYWKMAERCIRDARDHGIKVCGTVSTIWGCPIVGATDIKTALDFTGRWLDIGATDIEHADHDGSADPDEVNAYFSRVLNRFPNPDLHIAHFHTTRGWGLASVYAALQAGIIHFEGTLGGTGGQPANVVDGQYVGGTGDYYHKDRGIAGLVSTEDMVTMMRAMNIETGIDISKLHELGLNFEKMILEGRSRVIPWNELGMKKVGAGRIMKIIEALGIGRLRSESIHTGPVPDKKKRM